MVLEALFSGEIYPAETVRARSKEYFEALRSAQAAMSEFEQILSAKDYKRLESMVDDFSEAQAEENEEHFMNGFVLGVRLMQEIYQYPVFPKKE